MLTLARSLKENGIDTVAATSGGDLEGAFAAAGIPHRVIPLDTKCEFHPTVLRAALALRSMVVSERIDLIHAHSRVSQVASCIASRLAGVPVVTTCHGYFRKRLRGVFDTWGDRVIAISDAVRRHLIDDLGVREGRIALVYSGVDAERFARPVSAADIESVRRRLGIGSGPIIGTIGRLSPVKGHRSLIEAMALLRARRPDIRALLVGSGPERAALGALVSRHGLGDAVFFVDSAVDTRGYLPLMDVFVFPSLKEGLGIALLEAMAAGKACVSSRIGGISDIVRDGVDGVLVGAGDASAIARAVESLIADPVRRAALGEEARRAVRERFTLVRMAREIANVYEEVREEHGAKS